MKAYALMLLVALATARADYYDYGGSDTDDYSDDYGSDYEEDSAPGSMSGGSAIDDLYYDVSAPGAMPVGGGIDDLYYDDLSAPGADPYSGLGALPPLYDDLDLGLPPPAYDSALAPAPAPGDMFYPAASGPLLPDYGPSMSDPLLDYNVYGPLLPGFGVQSDKQKKVLTSLSHLLKTLAEKKKK